MGGDESAFAALTQRHRRELHIHCYRMPASFDEVGGYGPRDLPASVA
jgi:hypothetical protein